MEDHGSCQETAAVAEVPVPTRPALGALPADWEKQAVEFLWGERHVHGLDLVYDHALELRAAGLFEPCLLEALTDGKTNMHMQGVPPAFVRALLQFADPVRLRSIAPVPEQRSPYYRLYRGVAGVGKERQIRGVFWTDSLDMARWFALRWPWLPDPAVYTVRLHHFGIYAYYNGRHEHDFFVNPFWLGRVRRLETLTVDQRGPRPQLD